jgi:hypothetical protein
VQNADDSQPNRENETPVVGPVVEAHWRIEANGAAVRRQSSDLLAGEVRPEAARHTSPLFFASFARRWRAKRQQEKCKCA